MTKSMPAICSSSSGVIRIESRRVITPDGERSASIHIEDGRITAVHSYACACESEATHDYGDLVIMPGVVDIPTGGWWTPDENGIDRRGAVNVLSSERWSPLAFGNTQHTIMVQIEREQA